MDIVILLFILFGVVSISLGLAKTQLKCPQPKVIYRFIPKHTLDVQFGTENNPSDIYNDMFAKSSPWIGGYTLEMGKTRREALMRLTTESETS